MTLDKFNLKNRYFIITGCNGFLGRQHTEAILDCGGRVIGWDINSANSTKSSTKHKDNFIFQKVDITSEAEILAAVDVLTKKKINVYGLINNASIDPKVTSSTSKTKSKVLSRVENFQLAQWEMEIAVGLTGAFLCSKIVGQLLSKKREGVIVNIASDLGVIAPNQNLYKIPGKKPSEQPVKPITYSVIKHGILGLTKYLATYWAESGIRVNSISPGGMYLNQPPEFVAKFSEQVPLHRMSTYGEYKGAIVFLCSEASSYMTGHNLVIDGGRTIW